MNKLIIIFRLKTGGNLVYRVTAKIHEWLYKLH